MPLQTRLPPAWPIELLVVSGLSRSGTYGEGAVAHTDRTRRKSAAESPSPHRPAPSWGTSRLSLMLPCVAADPPVNRRCSPSRASRAVVAPRSCC